MEQKWLIGSLLAILIIVVSTGFALNKMDKYTVGVVEPSTSQYQSHSADIVGSVSHSMDLDIPVRAYPEKIRVYKTVPPDVSRSRLDEYAKKFNVSGTFRDGENAMSLQSEDLVFGIEIEKASGKILYLAQGRPNDTLDSPDKLPTDEEAIKIATQFLKEKDIYPEGIFLRTVEREYERSTDKNGNERRHSGRIIVRFGRTLNNLEIKGTQFDLEIGGNGDIIRFMSNWREYTPSTEYPIKSPETTFGALQQEGIRTDNAKPDSISINNVTLAYRTKAGAYKEEFLEPIWIFTGTASYKDTPSEPVSRYIPALSDDAVKSLSSS